MIRRPLPAALLLALVPALVPAAAAPQDAPPAEKPAAVVHGRPLARPAVYDALGRKFLRGPGGDRLLEQFLMDAAARREQARRGVTVSDEEVAAAIDSARREFAERMARAGRAVKDGDALEQFLRSSGFTLEEFRTQSRQYLALQKMAREDLAAPAEVPQAQIEVWLRDLLRKGKACVDPAALPEGAVATLGGEPFTGEALGRWLARTVKRHEILGVVYDLSFSLVVEERAAKDGVAVTDAEAAGEIYRLRQQFTREPSVEGTGLTFEDWLRERKGMSVEELRRDPSFRTTLLARRVLAAGLDDAALRKEWEARADRYGETARIRRILIRGDDRGGAFGRAARPMAAAREMADRALGEIRGGKAFDLVARKVSEDAPPEGPRGQPLEVSPSPESSLVPQSVLDEVFRAKEGDLLGPLRAVDGWHLVLVEKRTPAPDYEGARDRVREDLVARALGQWRLDLRNDREISIAEDL